MGFWHNKKIDDKVSNNKVIFLEKENILLKEKLILVQKSLENIKLNTDLLISDINNIGASLFSSLNFLNNKIYYSIVSTLFSCVLYKSVKIIISKYYTDLLAIYHKQNESTLNYLNSKKKIFNSCMTLYSTNDLVKIASYYIDKFKSDQQFNEFLEYLFTEENITKEDVFKKFRHTRCGECLKSDWALKFINRENIVRDKFLENLQISQDREELKVEAYCNIIQSIDDTSICQNLISLNSEDFCIINVIYITNLKYIEKKKILKMLIFMVLS